MGLFDRVKKVVAAPQPPQQRPVMFPPGAQVDAVGESFHLAGFEAICGPRGRDGVDRSVTVTLWWEQGNPHDANAVGLYVDGHKLGHLSKKDAAAFRPVLERAASMGIVCQASGWIGYGWDRGHGDTGDFCLRLNLAAPDACAQVVR